MVTGSFNFTKAAEQKNAENPLIIKSAEFAKLYMTNHCPAGLTGIHSGTGQEINPQNAI